MSLGGAILVLLAYWFCLPEPLFRDPLCFVLEDRNGELLGARIAKDDQWRFPPIDCLPDKFVKAVIEFEDRRFYQHPGVDPKAIGRAIVQNIRNGRIVSGGSTISMQVIRMSRKSRKRTVLRKFIEIIMATRLELRYSKSEILSLYASNAPFGGNVVGLEAASWRYYGKNPQLLSWSEAALLAVLPNSPALIHPGRNRGALLAKRNRLLKRLLEKGLLDSLSCQLAKEEPLPEKPVPLPHLAPHLLDAAHYAHATKGMEKYSRLQSTLDLALQNQLTKTLERHQRTLQYNEIHNLAALIIDVPSGEIVAYVGNVIGAGEAHGEQVDVVKAPRSTGSILKPLLYALMLQEGKILPASLIPDIPTQLSGYRPENYNEKYDGMVPARKALIRSLNVPMVRMLQQYGLEKFHFELQQLGFSTIQKPPAYYGLPLILGGAEASLLDITNAYASMSRMLNNTYLYDGLYNPRDFHPPRYIAAVPTSKKSTLVKEAPFIGAAATWFTFDAMQEVERPNSEGEWQHFSSSRRIAWKTGTSFGFRDAWAVGVTPAYAVGVWAGNADGEGRPGLVGIKAAAPVLFEIFNHLPASNWFDPPYHEMIRLPVCKNSGYRASGICPVDSLWVPLSGLKIKSCIFHQAVHLDTSLAWQVNIDCELPSQIIHRSWFVLPPVEEHYYRSKNPNYNILPPYRKDCRPESSESGMMQLIYPKYATRIYVPVDLDGRLSRTVFSVAHRLANISIHWHLDNEYIGSTTTFHNFELKPSEGKHLLTLVDENGNRLEQAFEIIGKK